MLNVCIEKTDCTAYKISVHVKLIKYLRGNRRQTKLFGEVVKDFGFYSIKMTEFYSRSFFLLSR